MKKIYLLSCGLIVLIASYSILLFVSPDEAVRIRNEDGVVETIAAICWFLAAIILFYMFIRSKSNKKPYFLKFKRNIFYLLLGLFFIFCWGEEISWGQRIFGLGTPETLQEINAQKEINIHNFWIFQSYDKNLNDKVGFQKWYSSARIFSLIWFLYCVLIPIINEYILKARHVFRRFYFPVIPLWIGILFLMNYIISKVFESWKGLEIASYVFMEVKETNIAFLFFIASISLYYLQKLLLKNLQTNDKLLI